MKRVVAHSAALDTATVALLVASFALVSGCTRAPAIPEKSSPVQRGQHIRSLLEERISLAELQKWADGYITNDSAFYTNHVSLPQPLTNASLPFEIVARSGRSMGPFRVMVWYLSSTPPLEEAITFGPTNLFIPGPYDKKTVLKWRDGVFYRIDRPPELLVPELLTNRPLNAARPG